MTKKKAILQVKDGFKQTDISTYFKATRTNSSTMNSRVEATNEKYGDDDAVISPRKKPRPIPSDGETEITDDDIINSLIGPLESSEEEITVIEKTLKFKECRVPAPKQTFNDLSKTLPLQLPLYTYSEDSDSDGYCDDSSSSEPQSAARAKKCVIANSKPTSVSCKNVPAEPGTKETDEIKPIVISSDDDFEQTPPKSTEVKGTRTKRNKRLEGRKKLFKSDNRSGKNNIESTETTSEPLSKPTSYTTSEPMSTNIIGIHKSAAVPTTSTKQQPQILQEWNKTNSKISVSNQEFVSTNFLQQTVTELSTSSQTTNLNDTIIYNTTITLAPKDNVTSMTSQVTVLGNVLVRSSKDGLENCNISPIKKVLTDSTLTENANYLNSSRNAYLLMDDDSHWMKDLFRKIVKYVGSHSHLKTMLTESESNTLKQYFSMPIEYQFFCFKLFTRLQKWYNLIKLTDALRLNLSKSEVKHMYDCLYDNKFVEIDYLSEPCIDLLTALKKTDLKNICNSFKIKVTTELKYAIIQKLLTNCNSQPTLTSSKTTEKILRERIEEVMGVCVKLSPDLYKLFKKVHLLYTFTSSDFKKPSDLHFFITKIISKEIYMPKVNVNTSFVIFSSIPQFSRYSEACECKQALLESHEKKETTHMFELGELAFSQLKEILGCMEEPKPSYLMRFTAGYKYTTTLTKAVKHLARHFPEKVEEWLIFLIKQDRYCLDERGSWFDWLIMVQYKYLKQYKRAANTMIEALERKDLAKVPLQELSYRAEQIKRSKCHKISGLLRDKICFIQPPPLREFPSIEIDAKATSYETERKGKRLYVKKIEEERRIMTVEDVALDYYFKKGWANGLHCEGRLLETIFFTLFWDIIYESAVPDAFILEIQYYPLDLMSPEFYTNRKNAIDARLNEIESKWPSDQLKNFICNIWEQHTHEKSFLNDEIVNEPEDLYNIVLCIGRAKLTKMLERLVTDFRTYRSGLPDLFLWTEKNLQCKYVEVKGEKDKLSAKQKVWLDFLLSLNADAEVCYVHNVGSKVARKMDKMKKE